MGKCAIICPGRYYPNILVATVIYRKRGLIEYDVQAVNFRSVKFPEKAYSCGGAAG
jgi:hypothetical protein